MPALPGLEQLGIALPVSARDEDSGYHRGLGSAMPLRDAERGVSPCNGMLRAGIGVR
jgi:hypothetical protein